MVITMKLLFVSHTGISIVSTKNPRLNFLLTTSSHYIFMLTEASTGNCLIEVVASFKGESKLFILFLEM